MKKPKEPYAFPSSGFHFQGFAIKKKNVIVQIWLKPMKFGIFTESHSS